MNIDVRRYAPLGLVISGLGFLTVLVILILRAFTAVDLFTPPDADLLDRIMYIGAVAVILGLAIFAALDPDRVRKFLTGRQLQYGSNAFVLFVAFTGILIVVNMLTEQLVEQYPDLRWDVTEDKQHTLAPETIEVLASMPEPVFATAFFSFRMNSGGASELLEGYKTSGKGNFDYQFIDPDTNPLLANDLGITGDGKILLQMGENHEIVTFASERELTSGLVRLLNPDQPVVYFLTGEGEHEIDSSGNTSYSRAKQVLENRNYIVNSLNLDAENAIPEDTRALVVAGPLVPLSENAVDLITDYMEAGGSLLLLANPTPLTEYENKPDPLGKYLVSTWGISLNEDIVVDPNSPSSPFFAISAEYSFHPITEKMQGRGVNTIFPFTRSISIDTEMAGVSATPLVYTTTLAWGETDYSAIEDQGTFSYDEASDQPGPMILVAAAEKATTEGRVAVFGSSTFAQDENFDFSGNGDMFVNTLDWVVEQESLIGITENVSTARTFDPPETLPFILTITSMVCIMPLVITGAGFYAWLLRRQRG